MTALEPVVTTKRANVGSGSNRRSFAAEWAVYKTILEAGHALGWPIALPSEPFGLVMIEAMAYGKSVIAFHCGSVPEVIENGTTGFVVNRCLVVVRQGCILKAIWARSTNDSTYAFGERQSALDLLSSGAHVLIDLILIELKRGGRLPPRH
jgi:Glycosyl transferases group 1